MHSSEYEKEDNLKPLDKCVNRQVIHAISKKKICVFSQICVLEIEKLSINQKKIKKLPSIFYGSIFKLKFLADLSLHAMESLIQSHLDLFIKFQVLHNLVDMCLCLMQPNFDFSRCNQHTGDLLNYHQTRNTTLM